MIKSMTSFAEASHLTEQVRCDVEIRSYNSRHLDIGLHLPRSFNRFEEGIRKLIAEKVARGRVEIRVSIEEPSEDSVRFKIDVGRAKAYYQALDTLKKRFGLESDITLEILLGGGDMIRSEERDKDFDFLWDIVSHALLCAIDDLDSMRVREGTHLEADLEGRLCLIEDRLSLVEKEAAAIPALYRERLMEKIERLTSGVGDIDAVRLAQEAAILADKSDISEEIVRALSHINQFREIMASPEPGGRKLNFLVQEFNREFNTMGAKAGSTELSHTIVELKSELEKIREQVQNIE